MKIIGKGSFTKAYLADNGKVYLKTEDPAKELLAMGWLEESKYLPKISDSDIDGYDYVTDFSAPISKIGGMKNFSEVGKDQYRLCREIGSKMHRNISHDKIIQIAETFLKDHPELLATIVDFIENFCNYTQNVGFEVSPRNVSVTSDGELLLLDCFFNFDLL